jgi:sugar diacid utilization regulator
LLQTLIADKGLGELVKVGAESMKNPIVVMDEGFFVLAASEIDVSLDHFWSEFLNRGHLPMESISNFRRVVVAAESCFSIEMQRIRHYTSMNQTPIELLIQKLLDMSRKDHQNVAARLHMLLSSQQEFFSVAVIQTVFYDSTVVVLTAMKQRAELPSHLETLRAMLESLQLACGVSRCFMDLAELHQHYLQAVRAAELGPQWGPQQAVYRYDALCLYDLLLAADLNTAVGGFCHPALQQISAYDQANATEYRRTLLEYLKSGGNITAAAKNMFIHRNTMVYRISKIAEFTELDLDEGEVRTQLLISYKIMEISKVDSIADQNRPVKNSVDPL